MGVVGSVLGRRHGRACDEFRRARLLLQFPGYGQNKHRTLSNLYLKLLHAAGQPRDQFGIPDSGLRDIDQSGTIAELLV